MTDEEAEATRNRVVCAWLHEGRSIGWGDRTGSAWRKGWFISGYRVEWLSVERLSFAGMHALPDGKT